MKFEMRKDKLLDTIDKMFTVATRGVKSEYTLAGRLTIEVKPSGVNFITSNGSLLAQCNIPHTNDDSSNEVGKATVDVTRMKKITHAVGGANSLDHTLTIDATDQSLKVSDQNKSKSMRKSEATVPVLKEHHLSESFESVKYKAEHTFSTELFSSGIHALEKYRSPMRNKMRYQVICLHFLKKENEVRFVCGDGMRFGIYIAENEQCNIDDKMYLLPVDQAVILTDLAGRTPDDIGGQKVEVRYKTDSTCHVIFDNGISAVLNNIPKLQYVDYARHAFRTKEACTITDVERSVLADGMALINACEDPDITNDTFHSAQFKSVGESLSLSVNEGKFQCKYEGQAFIAAQLKSEFGAEYCAQFLTDVSTAGNGKHIRFYCINEETVMIAEPMDLQDKRDEETKAFLPIKSDRRLVLFFASTVHGQ